MSLTREYLGAADFGFPRLRGDEPRLLAKHGAWPTFSPPTRG